MKPTFISFFPAIIWTIIILVLLIMPGSDIPSFDFFELIYFDKWVHIGLFALFTIFWGYPFIKSARFLNRSYLRIVFFAMLYGVLLEFVQKYFTEGRSFDFTDMIADTAGALLGFGIILFLKKSLRAT